MKSIQQLKNEAKAILNFKRRELGSDKNDREFYQHHLKKLVKIEKNKETIGEENYSLGNELLATIVQDIAQKRAKNIPLQNITPSKFNFSDLTKMHSTGISQNDINQINNRSELKDQVDMEDLMRLTTQDLKVFRNLIEQHKRELVIGSKEEYKVKKFFHVLNKVIKKHNSEHTTSQDIEPIEILIDLNKAQSHSNVNKDSLEKKVSKLPLLKMKHEEYYSHEISRSSSKDTIIDSYSMKSFSSETTEKLYPDGETNISTNYSRSSFTLTPSPTPPKTPKSSKATSRPSFRTGR